MLNAHLYLGLEALLAIAIATGVSGAERGGMFLAGAHIKRGGRS